MVAYSFKEQFIAPILAGNKRQTIRNPRKRHARAGEELQLYFGMRTRSCRLLGRSTCISVDPIVLHFSGPGGIVIGEHRHFGPVDSLNDFARADGFDSWAAMKAFWTSTHGASDGFEGVLIRWGDLAK